MQRRRSFHHEDIWKLFIGEEKDVCKISLLTGTLKEEFVCFDVVVGVRTVCLCGTVLRKCLS
jgi:hypothetical protein